MARAEHHSNVLSRAFPAIKNRVAGARKMIEISQGGSRFDGSDHEDDPLIALGKELKRLQIEFEELDAVFRRSGKPSRLRRQMRHIDDRQSAIKDFATTIEARSIEGALLQLSLVHSMVDSEDASDDRQRRIERLLFSAYAAISNAAKIDTKHTYNSYEMNAHLNPFAQP